MADDDSAAVSDFLARAEPPVRAEEGRQLCAILERATGAPPVLWSSGIIGFGRYHYRYASGREGDSPRVSFSPRKAQLVLYGLLDAPGHEAILARLGKHSTGKGCVYVRKLSDIDLAALDQLARDAFAAEKPDEAPLNC